MPIPKRTAKRTAKADNPKRIVNDATNWYYNNAHSYDNYKTPSYNNYNNTPSYNNNEKKSSWCWKYLLIIFWIFIIWVIINAVINDNSSNSSSYGNTTTTTSTATNSYEKDWKCKWSDWLRYNKPVHAYCDWWKTALWWSCNYWYTAKSENGKTWINSSRYCAANCEHFSCVWRNYIPCTTEQAAIPTYVNEYSQSSIDNYNAKIEAYNRCLSEKCSCA